MLSKLSWALMVALTVWINNGKITHKKYIEEIVKDVPNDKRFVYYLMAATGICVVPLSGMNSKLEGFRVTLLEPDEAKFIEMFNILKNSIVEYLQ